MAGTDAESFPATATDAADDNEGAAETERATRTAERSSIEGSANADAEREGASNERTQLDDAKPLRVLHGKATYYAQSFAGKLTTSEAPYDPKKLTAAMKTLPLGSVVRVTRVDTGESVVVEVNDRLPKRMGATIDLSRAAAERLDMIEEGIVKTRIEVLSMPEGR